MLSWLFSDPLPLGSAAPDFTLPDDAGNTVSLSAFRGGSVLLVFYPADNTQGCTKQLCQLRDQFERLQAKNIRVFGVNPGSSASHAGFRAKQKLPFPLLVDKGQQLAKLYNAHGIAVKRTVYLIGKDGKILLGQRGAPPPEQILAALD